MISTNIHHTINYSNVFTQSLHILIWADYVVGT